MKYRSLPLFGLQLGLASMFILPGFLLMNPAFADSANNLPLVFDPQTQKYFISGHSKFTLKKDDSGSIIDRIEVSVDGGAYRSYDDAIEFKNEGKHALKFRAVNPVNGWSPVQYVEVFVDLTPPTTEAKFSDATSYKADDKTFIQENSK